MVTRLPVVAVLRLPARIRPPAPWDLSMKVLVPVQEIALLILTGLAEFWKMPPLAEVASSKIGLPPRVTGAAPLLKVRLLRLKGIGLEKLLLGETA